jgi:hypothetical protein
VLLASILRASEVGNPAYVRANVGVR